MRGGAAIALAVRSLCPLDATCFLAMFGDWLKFLGRVPTNSAA